MVSTSLKRASLEDAWDVAKATQTPNLRTQLRTYEKAARTGIAGGSFSQVAANGRTSAFAIAGPGVITPAETVELWRELIDIYDSSKKWLTDCATYGLDPNLTEINGFPTPPLTAVQNPAAVTEQNVFDWMMAHIIAVTEIRSDYSRLGMGGVPYV